MRKLALIGGGGHCKSVLDSALAMNQFDEIVITDFRLPKETKIMGCRVAGTDEQLQNLFEQGFEYAFITVGSIGDAAIRKNLANMASDIGFRFPVICDPTACVSPFARIGDGSFIGKNAVLNAEVSVGEHCIINTGAILEHECSVGSYSHVSVGAVLCGDSRIGNESFIGAGSTVVQGLSIGNRVIIGANSTVLSNVGDNMKYYGIVKNFAKESKNWGEEAN